MLTSIQEIIQFFLCYLAVRTFVRLFVHCCNKCFLEIIQRQQQHNISFKYSNTSCCNVANNKRSNVKCKKINENLFIMSTRIFKCGKMLLRYCNAKRYNVKQHETFQQVTPSIYVSIDPSIRPTIRITYNVPYIFIHLTNVLMFVCL